MVSYTHQPIKGCGYLNDYWKLRNLRSKTVAELKAILRQQSYCFTTSSNKTRLLQLLSRQARGLLSYDACRANELTKFCTSRGLLSSSSAKRLKTENIKLLEKADDISTFNSFMSLPPEIRVMIYTIYFRSLPDLVQPTQPPLAKTSRIVRTETMPVFYGTCTFVMTEDGSRRRLGAYPSFGHITSKRVKQDFFDAIAQDHLASIRQLSVKTSFFGGRVVEWRNGKAKFVATGREGEEDNLCPLETSLLRYLNGIGFVPPGKGLTRGNFKEIKRIVAGGRFQLGLD